MEAGHKRSVTSTTYIKQYGAKRSATNYVRNLLERNFKNIIVLTNILGWKHGPHPEKVDGSGKNWVPDKKTKSYVKKLIALVSDDLKKAYASGEIKYLIVSKDPYAWYVSNIRAWHKFKLKNRKFSYVTGWRSPFE